ncbi:MAG TPA: YwhD family protein [Limnochordia bacterium]
MNSRRVLDRRLVNAACPDEQDPNALPIVSSKEAFGGKATALTAVLIDGDQSWFDDAACHGRTPLEQGIEWVKDPAQLTGGRRIYVVWLYVKPVKRGTYEYYGATAVDMIVDSDRKQGFKKLGLHADRLGDAIKGKIDLSILDDRAKRALLRALGQYPDVLANSKEALRTALGVTSAPVTPPAGEGAEPS